MLEKLIAQAIRGVFGPIVFAIELRIKESVSRMRASGWQSVQGHVESTKLEETDSSFHVVLAYSYSWENEYYAGFSNRDFAREEQADAFSAGFFAARSLRFA